MARMYVPSTPATRGESQGNLTSFSDSDPFHGIPDASLEAAAAARGFRLVRNDEDRPAANATKKAWTDYAKKQGATDADLDGLSRDEIRAQYGTDSGSATGAPAPGEPSEQDDATKPEDEGPGGKSGKPVTQRTTATRPSATQDSSAPASESKVKPGKS